MAELHLKGDLASPSASIAPPLRCGACSNHEGPANRQALLTSVGKACTDFFGSQLRRVDHGQPLFALARHA